MSMSSWYDKGMREHLVDVYYSDGIMAAATDREAAANRVFRHIEKLHAYDETIPWDQWFEDKSDELNAVLVFLQKSTSYHTYSEHFLAGMQHWDDSLVLSEENITSLQSFAFVVKEETWHALGQRENGVLLNALVDKIKMDTNFDLAANVGGNAPRAAGIGLYTGHVERYVQAWRTGEDPGLLGRWCQRTCKNANPQTWAMFCDRFPDAGVLIAHYTMTEQNTDVAKNFSKDWLLVHPEQHEALYAFLHNGPHAWALADDQDYGTDVAERAKYKSALMLSLFPEVKDAETYFRTYADVFLKNDMPLSLSLPEEMTP